MRRKILSIITILCLIFPCVFFVACKEKDTLSSKEPYTYSICLKNAKGLIDENALKSEFDYKENKSVNWTETDGSYTISATKVLSSSGKFVVNLLEGYDYSSAELKINNKKEDLKITSGDNLDAAAEASLGDRQLSFEYKDINSDTEVVIDFSECEIAKITIDVSNLKSNGVKYFEVKDDFVTLNDAKDISKNNFVELSENELVVDYGTIFAFNHSDSLATKDDKTGVSKKLDYATYGIRYFNSDGNKIQYLTARTNCACEVYSIREDNANSGSLRVLADGGIKFASSLENLEAGVYENTETDDEIFYGEDLEFTVYKGDKVFLELDSDASDYNYYLLDEINQTWTTALVSKQTDGETPKTYLEIDLDSLQSAKYLARKPRNNVGGMSGTSDYYVVSADDMETNTKIINADYILINKSNYDGTGTEEEHVYYGFKKGKDIRISLPATATDYETGFVQTIEEIKIFIEGNVQGNLPNISVDQVANPTQILTVSPYSDESEDDYFRLGFYYTKEEFTRRNFTLNTSGITLYEGEKVYYSTDLSSWQELNGETLQGSTYESKLIYFYISSSRTDSYLTIEFERNATKKIIGTSDTLRDCFGRTLQGLISVGGTQINLSNVMYLEINPGAYVGEAQANIIREYDKTYHKIDVKASYADNIMVSVNGYKNAENFENITKINGLSLRYEGYEIASEIYYYVDSNVNKYLVLKNAAGEIVSTSEVVYSNAKEYLLNGKFVFQLSLKPDYYSENEQFSIEIVTATYIIRAENSSSASIYKDNTQTQLVSRIELNKTYFILCDKDKTLQIVDKHGAVVFGEGAFVEEYDPITGNIVNNKKLYRFTFTLDSEAKYSPDSIFTIKII